MVILSNTKDLKKSGEVKTMTLEQIKKQNPNIAIGHPLEWTETAEKCRQNGDAGKKRLYAFSSLVDGCWHEPTRYYNSLHALECALIREWSNTSHEGY